MQCREREIEGMREFGDIWYGKMKKSFESLQSMAQYIRLLDSFSLVVNTKKLKDLLLNVRNSNLLNDNIYNSFPRKYMQVSLKQAIKMSSDF